MNDYAADKYGSLELVRVVSEQRLRITLTGAYEDDGSLAPSSDAGIEVTVGGARLHAPMILGASIVDWRDRLATIEPIVIKDDMPFAEGVFEVQSNGSELFVHLDLSSTPDHYEDTVTGIVSVAISLPDGIWDSNGSPVSQLQWTNQLPELRDGIDCGLHGYPVWKPETAKRILRQLNPQTCRVLTIDFRNVIPKPAPNIQPVPKTIWQGMHCVRSGEPAEAIEIIEDQTDGFSVEILVVPRNEDEVWLTGYPLPSIRFQ